MEAIISPDPDCHQKIVDVAHVMSTAGGVSTLSQIGAIAALTHCWYWVDEFIKHLSFLRDYAVKRLNMMPGVTCEAPQATYLLFPNIEATGYDAEKIVEFLRAEKIAVVPGNERFFGPGAKGHIRICFATSYELLSEGLDRMNKALVKLKEIEYVLV